jgi:serine/threonine protein phosphatase PrpC
VSLQFAGSEQDAMFAVYDGHGKNGHACARFAKNKLPRLVAKHLRAARVKKYKDYVKLHDIKGAKLFDPANWPYLTADEYKAVCRKAFLECNKVMHDTDSVRCCCCLFLARCYVGSCDDTLLLAVMW